MTNKKNTIQAMAAAICAALLLLLAAGPVLAQAQVVQGQQSPGRETTLIDKDAFTRGAPVPDWVGPLSAIPSGGTRDPVTVRLSESSFNADKEVAFSVHKATQVNEASALGQIGQSEIAFQANYQRVQLHMLRLHRGDTVIDKLADAEIRFLRREPELDSGIYGGAVTAAIVVNDIRIGDTLEVAYTVSGKNPVFGDRFFEAASWDGQHPILKRRVTLNVPAGRTVRYRVIGAAQSDAPKAVVQRVGNRQIVRFEADNLPAVDFEPYTPRDYQLFRWIQFSEYASWSEVEQWAENLFAARTAPAVLKDALASARAESNPADAVARALEFVQRDIRYLSVSLGENSHRPYAPDVVLARRYGDCKDKSLLLVTMLRQLGIEAAPALVSTSQRKGMEGMLPSPQLFDHVIVRAVVQGKTYFLDPTRLGQAGPLEHMGQSHVDVQALVVAPGVQQLVSIPQASADALVTNLRFERVTVTKMDQPVLMAVQLQYKGLVAETLRASLLQVSATQLRKFYEGNVGKRYPDGVLLGDPVITDVPQDNSITVDLQFRIRDFFTAGQERWTLRHQPDNLRDQFYVPGNPRRTSPLAVPTYPTRNRYQLEVSLPEEFDAKYNPSQRTLEGGPFVYSESVTFTGRTLKMIQDLQVRADRVAPSDVASFLTDVNKLGDLMHGTLTIRKSDIRSAASTVAAPAVPFKQQITDRLERVVKSSTQMIADAKSTRRDAGPALCERAKAVAYLGRHADALDDVQNAVRQQPNDADMLRCRAEVELTAGDFKASDQDFSRAMALGATDADMYLQRGIAAFYRGNYAIADGDFAKALQQTQQPTDKLRASIWRALALRRAGTAVPAELLPADAPADGDWQAAALQVFGSRTTAEAMLRLAHKESGNRLDVALTEAYFYLGQHYLLSQERTRARLYFQHAVDKGVLYSPYYNAARHELGRLN